MKYLKNLLFGIFLLAYCLVFAEFFLRILAPQVLMPRFVTGSDIGIRQNIPNSTYHHKTEEVLVDFAINSQGMRDDKDYTVEKPKGSCRVLMFGDSFFMSYEVSLRDSYAKRLEYHLRSSGLNCEILNFAVSGFGTAESLIQLQKRAVQYDPDYVVLEWHQSDVDDNFRSDLFSFRQGSLLRTGKSFLPGIATQDFLMDFSVYRWMIQYSHLYTAVREVAGGKMKSLLVHLRSIRDWLVFASDRKPPSLVSDTGAGVVTDSDLNTALVNEFHRESHAIGAAMLLVHIPFQNVFGDFESALPLLGGKINDEIVVVDPTTALKRHVELGSAVFYRKGHLHLNPDGYDIVARETANSILAMSRVR